MLGVYITLHPGQTCLWPMCWSVQTTHLQWGRSHPLLNQTHMEPRRGCFRWREHSARLRWLPSEALRFISVCRFLFPELGEVRVNMRPPVEGATPPLTSVICRRSPARGTCALVECACTHVECACTRAHVRVIPTAHPVLSFLACVL